MTLSDCTQGDRDLILYSDSLRCAWWPSLCLRTKVDWRVGYYFGGTVSVQRCTSTIEVCATKAESRYNNSMENWNPLNLILWLDTRWVFCSLHKVYVSLQWLKGVCSKPSFELKNLFERNLDTDRLFLLLVCFYEVVQPSEEQNQRTYTSPAPCTITLLVFLLLIYLVFILNIVFVDLGICVSNGLCKGALFWLH